MSDRPHIGQERSTMRSDVTERPKKIEVTLTMTVEHVDGPYRAEDWEQTALHSIEETLLNLDALWVPYSGPVEQAEYQITAVEVDDVFGAGRFEATYEAEAE